MTIAIVKPIKVRNGNIAGLRAVINYIKNESKTDKGALIYTKDCLKDKEYEQMFITKKHFGKLLGRQYAHFIQSFSKDDDLPAEKTLKIGKQFVEHNTKFNDFQVVMAVHTDKKQFHIHYVINSASHVTGQKWQCTPNDLKDMRAISDELCRENNLYVIEKKNKGNKSYGEYVANKNKKSWKQHLAEDIVKCLTKSNNKKDFYHALDKCGIDVDFERNNIMFTIKSGTYGLTKDMKCGNAKLMNYGDFSKQNIENYLKANKNILQLAFDDIPLLQEAFLEAGKILFPNNPSEIQDLYFGGMDYVDFDAMTREEIESYLKHKKSEQLRLKALTEREKQEQNIRIILPCIADILEEILKIKRENQRYEYFEQEMENEYEL